MKTMPKTKAGPVRVLVVDDSPTARELLAGILNSQRGIQVVGKGANGEDAIRLTNRLQPDVITMDIRMPVMDGLEATRQIMRDNPTPIVIISGNTQQPDMDLTFKAMRAGALTALGKPGLDDPRTCEKIAQTVRLMAGVQVVHHWHIPEENTSPAKTDETSLSRERQLFKNTPGGKRSEINIIGIAASTGGPSALATVLGQLPADYPLPVLIVQHVSPGFATGLAEWLNTQTNLRVELAAHGDPIRPGIIFLAPDDYHMKVSLNGSIELSKAPAYKGLRPSANFLFESLAQVYGAGAAGIIMTGMGDDGVSGLEAMYRAGALTAAQDEKTSVVYGMPREAVLRNAVDRVLSIEQIAMLLEDIGKQSPQRSAVPTERGR
jgi:two-component system, chemotaxis family, protein-glutamate methylesterase/glutaminase